VVPSKPAGTRVFSFGGGGKSCAEGAPSVEVTMSEEAEGTASRFGVSAHPERPRDLSSRSWLKAFVRSVREIREDNLTDWAAALTYYAVLAMFPALIVFVALVGLFGQYPETTDAILRIVGKLGPKSAVDTFREPITSVVRSKGGAGALLSVGLLGALWSASGYVGAFMRASNAIYEVPEGRRIWKLRPIQLLVTVVMVLLAAAIGLAIVATGPLARDIGKELHLPAAAVTAWDIAKWPVLFLLVITMFSILYYAAPNVRTSYRWMTPGGVVAVVVWLIASGGFAVYVANFASYNKTYGSLGGIIVFLVWMWITNLALLIGAEVNAELERRRQIESGVPEAEENLQPELRDQPKRRRAG
jgi:membrane protein